MPSSFFLKMHFFPPQDDFHAEGDCLHVATRRRRKYEIYTYAVRAMEWDLVLGGDDVAETGKRRIRQADTKWWNDCWRRQRVHAAAASSSYIKTYIKIKEAGREHFYRRSLKRIPAKHQIKRRGKKHKWSGKPFPHFIDFFLGGCIERPPCLRIPV